MTPGSCAWCLRSTLNPKSKAGVTVTFILRLLWRSHLFAKCLGLVGHPNTQDTHTHTTVCHLLKSTHSLAPFYHLTPSHSRFPCFGTAAAQWPTVSTLYLGWTDPPACSFSPSLFAVLKFVSLRPPPPSLDALLKELHLLQPCMWLS